MARKFYQKQSTNRFLISSDTEKKASNFRQKTIALASVLKLHPKRPVDQFQEKNPSKDIILFLHIGAPYLVSDQNFPEFGKNFPAGSSKLFSTCPENQFEEFFHQFSLIFRFLDFHQKYLWRKLKFKNNVNTTF